jgi:hypothetical protein
MIPVDSLLYKIDQKLNKLSSNEHQQIPLEDKILALNEAQIKLIKQKLDGQNTTSGLGLDAFKKRYEDLEKLIEMYEDHPLTLEQVEGPLNRWRASLEKVSPAYMFYVDSYIIADKGKCKDRTVYINNDLAKHADVPTLLKNTHYAPSFEYQETFNIISSDEISVFTDGTFTPKKLYLSYIRYPKYIDKEGYIKLDGTSSITQNCELKNYMEDELTDLTVEILAMYTENQSAAQSAQFRIKTDE